MALEQAKHGETPSTNEQTKIKNQTAIARKKLQEQSDNPETLLKNPQELLNIFSSFELTFTKESLKTKETMESFLQTKTEENISNKNISKELSQKIAKLLTEEITKNTLNYYRRNPKQNLSIKTIEGTPVIEMRNKKATMSVAINSERYPDEPEEETFDSLREKAGIEIRGGAFRFKIAGVNRSFKATKSFEKSLETLKTSDEIKLSCYEKLLTIISKDHSIEKNHRNYNKYKVAGGDNKKFEESNEELRKEITRLKSQANQKAEKNPIKLEEESASEEDAGAQIVPEQKEKVPPTFENVQKAKSMAIANMQSQLLKIGEEISKISEKNLTVNTTQKPYKIMVDGKDSGYVFDVETEDHMQNNGEFRTVAAIHKVGEQGKYKAPNTPEWRKEEIENTFRDILGIPRELTKKQVIELKNARELAEEHKKYSTEFKTQFDSLSQEAKSNYGGGYEIKQRDYCKRKIRKILEKTYSVDKDFGKITEEKIREKFKDTDGYKKIEFILKNKPFGYHVEQTPKVFASILSRWSNSKIGIDEVFEITKDELRASAKGKIPEEYFSSYIQFGTKLAEESLKKQPNPVYRNMIELVLAPAQTLITATQAMDIEVKHEDIYKDWDKAKSPGLLIAANQKERRQNIEKLYSEQKDLIQGIFKLCGYDDQASGDFEHIIAILHGGGKDHMTMTDIDGKTFTVDEGAFKRYNSPVAAVYALTNQKGLYNIEEGKKVLNKNAITKEANRLIKLGYINKFLANEGDIKTIQSPQFQKNLEALYIKDFKNLSPKQAEAFQTGYLVSESTKFSKQFEVKDAKGEKITVKHPALQKTIQELVEKGFNREDISRIQDMVLSVSTSAQFKEQPNGTWKLEGGTIGLPAAPLGNGARVSFDIIATKKGDVMAGMNLVFTIVDRKNYTSTINTSVGMQGFSAGLDQTMKGEYINANLFLGASWDWTSIVPTFGGRFVLSINNQAGIKREIVAAEDASKYKEAWAKWDSIPKDNTKAKFELLKSIPTIWNTVQPLMQKFALEEGDIVQMFENVKDQITEDTLENYGDLALIQGLGVAMVGPTPMPIVQIKIGSAIVSIPNRKELSRILPKLSSKVTDSKIEAALKNLGEKRYVSTMPNLKYNRNGELITLIKSDEIDLSSLAGGLEESNKNLAVAELQLEQTPDGKTKLNIFNTEDKDVEIYFGSKKVTPSKNGELYLEGNPNDLIISRERFTMPFERDEYKASVRDVITIRSNAEYKSGMDSEWMQNNVSGLFVQKLMGQKEYKTMTGLGTIETAESEETMPTGFTNKELAQRKSSLERRRRVVGTKTLEEYKKQEIGTKIFSQLDTLYKDNKFKTEFRKITNNPKKIIELVKENGVEMNDKQANLAVIHLLNKHFTNLARNKNYVRLRKGLKDRITWVKPIFRKRFKENLIKLGYEEADATNTAAQLTENFLKTMYNELLNALKTDKTFEYGSAENIVDIPKGASFYSGSRKWEKGKVKRALDETIDYNKLATPAGVLHEFGFLTETTKEYSLNSTDPDDKLIARLLLEIASPLKEGTSEFLHSKLALKVGTTAVGTLLMAPEDYDLVTDLYKNPAKISDLSHKAAFDKFKALVTEIREKQLAGETFKKEIRQNITVEIKPSTKIVAGAYTKCGNASFYVEELGEITVSKRGQVVGVYNATNDRTEATMAKITATILGSVSLERAVKPRPGKPHEKTPKGPGQGKSHEKPGLGNPEFGNPNGNIPAGSAPSLGKRPVITPQKPDGNIPG